MTLEENFKKTDERMEKLSDDSLPREESFGVYKEGMEYLNNCRKIVDDIEEKYKQLAASESSDDGNEE